MIHRTSLANCAFLAVGSLALAACGETPPPARRPLAVGVVKTSTTDYAPEVALTGEIAARVSSDLSFRVGGRILERKVDVGDRVTRDQVLAIMDPQEQQANVAGAEADVASAEAKLRQATSTLERQKTLIGQGFTTRREYDQAEQDVRTSEGSLDSAKAQLGTARDQLDQTVLKASAAGIITARSAEAGQVVQSAQTIYTLAEDGPRDAVFNVYESVFIRETPSRDITIALVSDPKESRAARPREISPVVDSSGGTVKVKFDIIDPSPAMTLGAPVIGAGRFEAERRIVLAWSALSARDGKPAVWVVDPGTKTVSLRPIAVEAYEVERVVVRDGLEDGLLVVSKGQQLLRPGQVVDPIPDTAS